MTAAMRVAAPAKLNLTLEVLARRDDGFHELDSVVGAIDLADELLLAEAGERSIEYTDGAGQRVSILTSDDIVGRAWDALAAAVPGVPIAGAVRVVKRIPVAAGLGGGSTDAAAFLRAANALWDLGLERRELAEIGARVGSDVPVCLAGGFARMRGRGEQVEALLDAACDDVAVVLHTPEIPVPAGKTGAMYGALRPSHFSKRGASERLAKRLKRWGLAHDDCANTFDQVADEVMTGLAQARRRFAAGLARAALEAGLEPPRPVLAGAGPSLFALLPVEVAHAARRLLAGRGVAAGVHYFVGKRDVERVEC